MTSASAAIWATLMSSSRNPLARRTFSNTPDTTATASPSRITSAATPLCKKCYLQGFKTARDLAQCLQDVCTTGLRRVGRVCWCMCEMGRSPQSPSLPRMTHQSSGCRSTRNTSGVAITAGLKFTSPKADSRHNTHFIKLLICQSELPRGCFNSATNPNSVMFRGCGPLARCPHKLDREQCSLVLNAACKGVSLTSGHGQGIPAVLGHYIAAAADGEVGTLNALAFLRDICLVIDGQPQSLLPACHHCAAVAYMRYVHALANPTTPFSAGPQLARGQRTRKHYWNAAA